MEFRCERDLLKGVAAAAGRATGHRSSHLPVLSFVRLSVAGDQLTASATDLDLAIDATVTVGGVEDGAALVPGKLFVDVVSNMPAGAVTVAAEDDTVTVTAARSEFQLRTYPADDFPRQPPLDEDPTVVSAKEFVAALARVVPAASTDDSRPILCGVLLETDGDGMKIVATNSYRLACQSLPGVTVLGMLPAAGADASKVLVPASTIREVVRLVKDVDDLEVRFSDRQVSFRAGGLTVTGRLIEGEFPKYGGLVPKERKGRLAVSRDDLQGVARQAAILATGSEPVKFVLGSGGDLFMTAQAADVGGTKIGFDADYDGDEMVVGFNPSYLADALDACPSDRVWIDVIDGRQPAVLTAAGDDDRSWFALLMPVRMR